MSLSHGVYREGLYRCHTHTAQGCGGGLVSPQLRADVRATRQWRSPQQRTPRQGTLSQAGAHLVPNPRRPCLSSAALVQDRQLVVLNSKLTYCVVPSGHLCSETLCGWRMLQNGSLQLRGRAATVLQRPQGPRHGAPNPEALWARPPLLSVPCGPPPEMLSGDMLPIKAQANQYCVSVCRSE